LKEETPSDGRETRRTSSWLDGLARAVGGEGRLKGPSARALVWLGLLIVLGLALMGAGSLLRPLTEVGQVASPAADGAPDTVGPGGTTGTTAATGDRDGVWISVSELEAMMERTLERILGQIQGAGRVAVAVSLEAGATYVYGYDETSRSQTTEERDSSGGSRVVTQTDSAREAVIVTQGGSSQPVVVRVELPPIRGVVVVSSGAADSRVKALLSQAVQVLYGVPAHRVVVIAGG